MAQVSTYEGTPKTFVKITMGPKEAQSLRNLLARVRGGSDTATARNLNSIRQGLIAEGFDIDGTLSKVNAGVVTV